MGSEREVCPKCDRQVATDDDWNAGELDQQIEGGPSPRTEDLCWGGHQCNDAAVDWRTRAHAAERDWEVATENWRQASAELAGVTSCLEAAERRAAVLAALLGCAGEVAAKHAEPEWGALNTDDPRFAPRIMPGTWLRFLATDPRKLMRLVPETAVTIETALGAAGLTIEDLDVLEENHA